MRANPPDHRTQSIAAGMLTNGYTNSWVWNKGDWVQITLIIHGTKGVTIRAKGSISHRLVLRYRASEVIQVTKTPGYSMLMPSKQRWSP